MRTLAILTTLTLATLACDKAEDKKADKKEEKKAEDKKDGAPAKAEKADEGGW